MIKLFYKVILFSLFLTPIYASDIKYVTQELSGEIKLNYETKIILPPGNWYVSAITKTHQFPVILLRLFLVYGIGQKNNRFIPQVIEGCTKKKSFPVSSGNQIRDFCYIDDVVKAIISSLRNKKSFGEVINIASGNPVKIKCVINSIIKKVGFGKADFGKIKYRDFENMKLYADVTKAKKLLKWKPTIALDEGLDLIINSKLKR